MKLEMPTWMEPVPDDLMPRLVRGVALTAISKGRSSATGSGFPFISQFARTLRRDLGAAELAITSPWNNGPMEGNINRLKALKRHMYGRAGFELLRARVLPLAV